MQYVPCTPENKQRSAKRVTGARVLTSSEGLTILKEKEEKKQKEADEKQMRKQEREDKRKQREELMKRKAEERERRATEKKNQQRSQPKRASKAQPKMLKRTTEPRSTSTSAAMSADPQVQQQNLDSMDQACCECLRTYGEDIQESTCAEWVKCACEHWIHKECVDEVVFDSKGKERFCSY